VGLVTGQGDCEYWKGLLAVEAIGQLEEPDRVALLEHVHGCARCSADRSELLDTVSALALAEGAFVEEGAWTDALPALRTIDSPDAVDGDMVWHAPDAGIGPVHEDQRSGRAFRRALVGLSAAVAAALMVVAGSLGIFGGTPGPALTPAVASRTVPLHGGPGNFGTAVLVSTSWGTSIELTDHIEAAPQVLTVMMRTAYGRPWFAGTYRSTAGSDARVTLGCALSVAEIRGVTVVDSGGHEILQS